MADHQHPHGHQHQHADPHAHGPHADGGADEAALAAMLDLDAEVLAAHLSDLTAWIADAAASPALPGAASTTRQIVDVGAGTGAGTFALLRRFDGAEVTALDRSPYMLQRLRDRARELGVSDRVRTTEADLDETWPDAGPADLVWASASLHHMADPDRALAEAAALLRPGGLLAAVELDSFPLFLPDDIGLGRPGLEERCRTATDERRAHDLPHMGDDWGTRLTAAGFTVRAERHFTIDLAPPLPAATGRYAHAVLARIRDHVGDALDPDDLAVLATLLDGDGPDALLRRGDLTVRTTRTAWLAERGQDPVPAA